MFKKTKMGILKKSGSWITNKHTKRVQYSKEFHSDGIVKKSKKFDGCSDESYYWMVFIEDIIIYKLRPSIAWTNVPEIHLTYVWCLVLDVLDRYFEFGRFMSMPYGSRSCFSIKENKHNRLIYRLDEWVNYNIIRYDYLEITSKYVNVLEDVEDVKDDPENDPENDPDKDWNHIKETCCLDVIYVHSRYGISEI